MEHKPWSFEQQELAIKLFSYMGRVKLLLGRIAPEDTVFGYDDIFEGALIKAVNHFNQFRSEAEISSWFIRISINELLDKIRKKKIRAHISMRICDHYVEDDEGGHEDFLYFHPDTAPNPEEVMITKNLLAEMKNILSEDEWWLIEQRYLFGKQNRKIARETGVNEETLKVKLFRARFKLELFGILPPKRITGPKKTYKKRKPKTMGAVAGG